MPKQRITETDLTGLLNESALSNTVFVPVIASTTFEKPVLCINSDELSNVATITAKTGTGYKLAAYLIKLGFYVLYQEILPINGNIPESIWKALNDKSLYDIRFLTTGDFGYTDPNAIICAANRGDCVALCDEAELDVPATEIYILQTSQNQPTGTTWPTDFWRNPTASYIKLNEKYAAAPTFESGKFYSKIDNDCYSLLLTKPTDWESEDETKNWKIYYNKEITYSQATASETYKPNLYYLKKEVTGLTSNVDRTRNYFENVVVGRKEEELKFAAAFTPSFYSIDSNLTGDKTQSTELHVPASFGYLFAYARSLKNNNPEWYAIAGSFRGEVTEVNSFTYTYSNADCEILQARAVDAECELDEPGKDNFGIAINPIAYIIPFGNIVWGNRTMLKNEGDLKATSFLNIRNLVSSINKKLYQTARKYTFEQNNDILWINFQAAVTPLLDKMQSGNGILGYKFIKQVTNKKARLNAKLRIIPIEAVEDFDLNIELNNSLNVTE